MKRPAYTREELSKTTDDELVSMADEKMKIQVMRRTNKDFSGELQRLPSESEGQFRQRRREAVKADKAEFPRVLRANLEAAILNSPDNQAQAKMDKMFAGMRSSPEEKAELAAHQEARARRDAMSDREGGRAFTAGPVPSTAQWEAGGAEAKAMQAPAPAPKPAANPTRPTASRSKGRKK